MYSTFVGTRTGARAARPAGRDGGARAEGAPRGRRRRARALRVRALAGAGGGARAGARHRRRARPARARRRARARAQPLRRSAPPRRSRGARGRAAGRLAAGARDAHRTRSPVGAHFLASMFVLLTNTIMEYVALWNFINIPAHILIKAGAELKRLISTLFELVERGDRALSAVDGDSESASTSSRSSSNASADSGARAARREDQVLVALHAAACLSRLHVDSDAHSAMLERTSAFLLHALETLTDQHSVAIVCCFAALNKS